MKKIWKIIIGVVVVIVVAMGAFFAYTSTLSPEEKLTFNNDGLEVKVVYCRPYKKDREIFGKLIPYGEVWRTGANAATIVSFNRNVTIAGKSVVAGEYTLWTIPNENNWTVILNKETGQWGTNYDENEDLLRVDISAEEVNSLVEQFTITLTKADTGIDMNLSWDNTRVVVPIR